MRTLKDLTCLPHSFTLFIPSTVDVDRQDKEKQNEVFSYLSSTLSRRYGGATEYNSVRGDWYSESKGLVREDTILLTVFTPDCEESTQNYFISFGEFIKNEMNQESVFLVVDGKGYLI